MDQIIFNLNFYFDYFHFLIDFIILVINFILYSFKSNFQLNMNHLILFLFINDYLLIYPNYSDQNYFDLFIHFYLLQFFILIHFILI